MAKDKEWKDESIPELLARLEVLNRELFELRSELAVQRKLEKPHLLKAKRRERARILTFLTQKEREGAVR